MAACDALSKHEILSMMDSKAFGKGNRIRNQCLFALECCTGARVSEVLGLARKDIIDESGRIRERITFTKTKNKCPRTVPITNLFLLPYIDKWLVRQQDLGYQLADSPLFPGRGRSIALSRQWVYRLYKSAARELGLHQRIGTHSCRKSWAKETWQYYEGLRIAGHRIDPTLKLKEAGGWKDYNSVVRYMNFMAGDTLDSQMSIFAD